LKDLKVRAIYRAATVPGYSAPYDTLTLKIYYPCNYQDSFEERNTGFIPADESRAPFPVVILMPGTNVPAEAFGWLAHKLAEAGFAVVTYSWVTLDFGDSISLSTGVNLKRLTRKRYGKKPSCPAIPPILKELKQLQKQEDGLLAGKLDLDRVILGGHSAGGTMALLNANSDWFAQVCGAFSYAAHTAGNVMLDWEEGSIMPIASDLPLLIMGGTRDGVIAASSHRYGDDTGSSSTQRIEQTFASIKGSRGDRYLVIVEGANHFSFVRPGDRSTGRPFLDLEPQGSKRAIRKYLAQLVISFCDHVCTGNAMSSADLQGLCNSNHPLAAIAENK
jgi:predicted dienelactone hydrolase